MSLDVYLKVDEVVNCEGSGIFIRENGANREITREEWDAKFPGCEPVVIESGDETNTVYSANITHNLGKMAGAAGIYYVLWRPDEVNIEYAHQLVGFLESGLAALKANPDKFQALNPANGWGTYAVLVEFVENYLAACKQYPEAEVSVWR